MRSLAGYGSTIHFVDSTPERVVVEIAYDGRAGKPPPHLHPSQEERFEVLEGEINVLLDGERRTLREGDTLLVPAGTVHQMWAEEPARQRWETRPALETERFFETRWGMQADGVLEGDPRRSKLQMALTMHHFRRVIRPTSPPGPALAALSLVARARGLKPEYRPKD
jgi:mannose-6-phosphate isomerase-like protein (cupin superfamily)